MVFDRWLISGAHDKFIVSSLCFTDCWCGFARVQLCEAFMEKSVVSKEAVKDVAV